MNSRLIFPSADAFFKYAHDEILESRGITHIERKERESRNEASDAEQMAKIKLVALDEVGKLISQANTDLEALNRASIPDGLDEADVMEAELERHHGIMTTKDSIEQFSELKAQIEKEGSDITSIAYNSVLEATESALFEFEKSKHDRDRDEHYQDEMESEQEGEVQLDRYLKARIGEDIFEVSVNYQEDAMGSSSYEEWKLNGRYHRYGGEPARLSITNHFGMDESVHDSYLAEYCIDGRVIKQSHQPEKRWESESELAQ